jgi:hypothetical protein
VTALDAPQRLLTEGPRVVREFLSRGHAVV